MGLVNKYLYYQDVVGMNNFSRKELLDCVKCFFAGITSKQMLKENGIKITSKSTKGEIINALLLYGRNTHREQVGFTINKEMDDLYKDASITTVDQFLEGMLKIDNKVFVDAGVINDGDNITLDILNTKYSSKVNDMEMKESFIKAEKMFINKGDIICAGGDIGILKNDISIVVDIHYDSRASDDLIIELENNGIL